MIADKNRVKGESPAVVLINPKYAHNVGGALRMCSCFGVNQLWWTGDRVTLDHGKGERLPREERMKDYARVMVVDSFDQTRIMDRFPDGVTPVCVELVKGAQLLPHFEHPEHPVYVFGPEDGSVPQPIRALCHSFVAIPVAHCLNLSVAVGMTLYDRLIKDMWAGRVLGWTMDQFLKEQRGCGWYDPAQGQGIEGLKGTETGFNER